MNEDGLEKLKPTIVNLLVALYKETENFKDEMASKIAQRIRRNALRLSNAINSVQDMRRELIEKIIKRRTSFIEKDLKKATELGFFDSDKLAFVLVILAEIRMKLFGQLA
ncbi:hypothetical protein [Portibacter marinus]|uniref:hypothetical protein n=1 Tax=Portibacter marinus TaxID=2898660 RepID=UPI001F19A88D|nr:hypothetical protein [Portibacter marinus]